MLHPTVQRSPQSDECLYDHPVLAIVRHQRPELQRRRYHVDRLPGTINMVYLQDTTVQPSSTWKAKPTQILIGVVIIDPGITLSFNIEVE